MVNVAGLITQVQHHPIAHRLVKLVGVNEGAKHLHRLLLILLHQGSASEANKKCLGQYALHGSMQLARLGTVTLIHKHKEFALGRKISWQASFELGDKFIFISLSRLIFFFRVSAKFVYQRAKQPRVCLVKTTYQIGPTLGTQDLLFNPGKYLLYLLIEFGTVSDDQDTAVSDILSDPLGQPHHGQAFTATLGMPDDPALMTFNKTLGRRDPEILVMATGLLHPTIEHDKVVN
ncbi:hypothetical protein D3C81_1041240 [compost metagenome]